MWLTAAKLALAPVLLLQGLRVRRLALRLPEAAGPRHQTLGAGARQLRLLIVGDSATAGVGAEHQGEALAGRLGDALLRRAGPQGVQVHWRLVAQTGSTSADALALLDDAWRASVPAPLAPPGAMRADAPDGALHADVAVVALGVNDVTGQVSIRRWLRTMEAMAQRLAQRHRVGLIVVSGLPPMHLFPALPQPLRWYLGASARRYDRALRRWTDRRPDAIFVPLPEMTDPAMMARDGFHPGPPAYGVWAETLAASIAAARHDLFEAGAGPA